MLSNMLGMGGGYREEEFGIKVFRIVAIREEWEGEWVVGIFIEGWVELAGECGEELRFR